VILTRGSLGAFTKALEKTNSSEEMAYEPANKLSSAINNSTKRI
jgi:hypothetical protein